MKDKQKQKNPKENIGINKKKIKKSEALPNQHIDKPVKSLKITQGYVIVENDKKLMLLLSLLQKQKNKKILILVQSLHQNFLNQILPELGVQNLFEVTEFDSQNSGVHICSQPLKNSQADLIIQYDLPENTHEYIQKIQSLKSSNDLLLFLSPKETEYVEKLKASKIDLIKLDFPSNKLLNSQDKLEKLIDRNYHLHSLAHQAYRQYILNYNSHDLKSCFDISSLDYVKLGKQFGFRVPPRINLGKLNDIKQSDKQTW